MREARYRLTKRTLVDYGSSQMVSHMLARIPDGTHHTDLPQVLIVGEWASTAALGDEFTVTIAPTASHSANPAK